MLAMAILALVACATTLAVSWRCWQLTDRARSLSDALSAETAHRHVVANTTATFWSDDGLAGVRLELSDGNTAWSRMEPEDAKSLAFALYDAADKARDAVRAEGKARWAWDADGREVE